MFSCYCLLFFGQKRISFHIFLLLDAGETKEFDHPPPVPARRAPGGLHGRGAPRQAPQGERGRQLSGLPNAALKVRQG